MIHPAHPWLYEQLATSPYGGRDAYVGSYDRDQIIEYFNPPAKIPYTATDEDAHAIGIGKVADWMWNDKEILLYGTRYANVFRVVVRYPEQPRRKT